MKMPMIGINGLIKTACALVLAGTITVKVPIVAPLLLRPTAPAAAGGASTLPERIRGTEDRLAAVERRLERYEDDREHQAERMAKLEQTGSTILAFMIPIALFLFTQTVEIWRGPRRREEAATDLVERVARAIEERDRAKESPSAMAAGAG
jgi:hypothetical protein